MRLGNAAPEADAMAAPKPSATAMSRSLGMSLPWGYAPRAYIGLTFRSRSRTLGGSVVEREEAAMKVIRFISLRLGSALRQTGIR